MKSWGLVTKILVTGLFFFVVIEYIETTQDEQEIINSVILDVMGGPAKEEDRKKILEIIDRMVTEGAEAVMLGCTELPLVVGSDETKHSLIDSISVGVKESTMRAYEYSR